MFLWPASSLSGQSEKLQINPDLAQVGFFFLSIDLCAHVDQYSVWLSYKYCPRTEISFPCGHCFVFSRKKQNLTLIGCYNIERWSITNVPNLTIIPTFITLFVSVHATWPNRTALLLALHLYFSCDLPANPFSLGNRFLGHFNHVHVFGYAIKRLRKNPNVRCDMFFTIRAQMVTIWMKTINQIWMRFFRKTRHTKFKQPPTGLFSDNFELGSQFHCSFSTFATRKPFIWQNNIFSFQVSSALPPSVTRCEGLGAGRNLIWFD